jgi:uncharacterized membrane protein
MDKIKKYKRQSIYSLIASIVFLIVTVNVIMQFGKLGHIELVSLVLVLAWVTLHIDYVKLRTKIEILEELRKEESNKQNKEN